MATLICPKCGSQDIVALSIEGALARAIATAFFFGAIGNLLAAKKASKDESRQTLFYKCQKCRNRFNIDEKSWANQEPLTQPCKVVFHREFSFVGAAVPRFVYLNGRRVGEVKTGKSIEFETSVRSNVVAVTDQFGGVVRPNDLYCFDATEGGTVHIRFKGRFIRE